MIPRVALIFVSLLPSAKRLQFSLRMHRAVYSVFELGKISWGVGLFSGWSQTKIVM